jgi:uncharacterized linocin/CFP29 family protein
MDILRRSLAPISAEAWEEIDEQAGIVFRNVLTARRFADVEGPKGIDFGGINLGRLEIEDNQKDSQVQYGIHRMQPLMEIRKSFTMDIWELDNAVRGAEDTDLSAMEEAAGEIAEFEEKTIYQGFDKACISGLKGDSGHKPMNFPDEPTEILRTIADAVGEMRKSFVEGPYNLVVGEDKWQKLMMHTGGYPLKKQVEDLIGGEIILNFYVDEGFLVSARGGDFKLTLGQDLAIGYESHSEKEVQLYLTESFTFRVLEPAAVLVFE